MSYRDDPAKILDFAESNEQTRHLIFILELAYSTKIKEGVFLEMERNFCSYIFCTCRPRCWKFPTVVRLHCRLLASFFRSFYASCFPFISPVPVFSLTIHPFPLSYRLSVSG